MVDGFALYAIIMKQNTKKESVKETHEHLYTR
jgi:hypothetical protein